MKIWILIFSTALFVGGTCLGVALQPKLVPTAKAETRTDSAPAPAWGQHHGRELSLHRFTSELKLSDEQDRELDAILTESQDELKYLGSAMRAAQDKSRQRITDILTPEQKKRLDELMAAERQKRSDAELSKTVASYSKILKLSEDQAKDLRTALENSRSRRREMKHGEDYQQIRKSAREEQNKALEKSFTPEQYQRYLEVSELERNDR
ncbi:MAG TPA: hypothetical protein VE981_23450 [Planctomycetota bacterium]|nr:hypothetical protein [Planctomycetota bacterium]